MNNQIHFSSNSNVFAPIQSSGATYAITKPFSNTLTAETNKESDKAQKSNKLGYEIAVTALVAGIGALTLTKGLPKPIRLQLEKFMEHLDKKADVIRQNKHLNKLQQLKLNIIETTKSMAQKSEVILDTAPLKDVLLHSALKKIPGLKQIDEKITTVFRNISVTKYENAYAKSLNGFDKMYADLAEANSKLTNTEDIKKANDLLENIKLSYDKTFSATTRRTRLNQTIKDLDGLDDEVMASTFAHPKDYIKNKIKNPTFISEEKAAPFKNKLKDDIETPLNDLKEQKDKLIKIYKNSLSNNEYKKLDNSSSNAFKKLDNAVNIEKDKLFDKLRDLAIGSAPMDVFGIFTSIGVISWQLQKADNNDERISISLKSGIPIVGGMLTSLYCALALVSAGPSLFLGLASGLAINKIGSFADKYRKENRDKPFDLVEKVKPEGLMPIKDDKITDKTKKSV